MKNQPYVKVFKNGILANPIESIYQSGISQRRLNRNHERIIKHDFIKNKAGKTVFMLQKRTKRGLWLNVKQLN
jgi:hypothetical protein